VSSTDLVQPAAICQRPPSPSVQDRVELSADNDIVEIYLMAVSASYRGSTRMMIADIKIIWIVSI